MDPEGMWHHALPGLDYFDEEAKCYSRLFEFCQVTFCHSRQGLRTKFYSRLHLELNSGFFLRASRGGFPSRSRLDSDHCCFSPSPLHSPDHKSTSYYPYLVIFISCRLCTCSWRISPVHTSWNWKIKPQYMLTMICLIPYHGVHFADYLSNLPITWMSHWDLIWITHSWPEGTCSSSEMCIKGELFPQAPLYLQQLCLPSFAFSSGMPCDTRYTNNEPDGTYFQEFIVFPTLALQLAHPQNVTDAVVPGAIPAAAVLTLGCCGKQW